MFCWKIQVNVGGWLPHQPGPLVGLVHQCGPELSLSENVGKEFSVCVISVICHCLSVQYRELCCRLHHGLTRPRVQQINNTFVKVILFKTTAITWRTGRNILRWRGEEGTGRDKIVGFSSNSVKYQMASQLYNSKDGKLKVRLVNEM